LTSYDFTSVTGDHTIAASFAIDRYTLTYTAGDHGSISGDSPQTVDYDTDGTAVTAVPATGYHFVKWSDDIATATRTDTSVAGNVNVTAEFEADVPSLSGSDLSVIGENGAGWLNTPDVVVGLQKPVLSGSFDTIAGASGGALSCDVVGTRAYVANSENGGVQIFDVSDAAHPVLRGTFGLNDAGGHNDPRALTAVGNRLYTVDGGELAIWDVSDPGHVAKLGACASDGISGHIVVADGYAYTFRWMDADLNAELLVFDVHEASAPVLRGTCALPQVGTQDMAVHGDYLYATYQGQSGAYSGIKVIDVSDKQNPHEVGDIPLGYTDSFGLAVSGSYLYSAEAWAGEMSVYDLSDPVNPSWVTSCSLPDNAFGIGISGHTACLGLQSGKVAFVDIGDPANPVATSVIDVQGGTDGDFRRMASAGADVACFAEWQQGVRFVDIGPAFHYSYALNADSTPTYDPGTTDMGTGRALRLAGLADGAKYLHVRVSLDGTVWSAPAIKPVNIDTMVPTMTVGAPADGAHYAQHADVRADFSVTDDGSGLSTVTADNDGTTIVSGDAIDTSSLGSHTFSVDATDKAGNENWYPITYTVVADASAPTTQAATTPDIPASGWLKGAVDVGLTADDHGGSGVSGVVYSLDGSANVTTPGATTTVHVTGDGRHSLNYRSTDRAGNVEPWRSTLISAVSNPLDGQSDD
ncbi:MAG: hypothetical protein WCN81_12925, partial [Actinomycetes bacterium]